MGGEITQEELLTKLKDNIESPMKAYQNLERQTQLLNLTPGFYTENKPTVDLRHHDFVIPNNTLGNLFADLMDSAVEILFKKNNDYSYGDDPYSNFRGSSIFHVEPEIGILLRMSDKMKRVETFVNSNNLKVKEESVIDACIDLINYSVLLAGLLNERIEKEQNNG